MMPSSHRISIYSLAAVAILSIYGLFHLLLDLLPIQNDTIISPSIQESRNTDEANVKNRLRRVSSNNNNAKSSEFPLIATITLSSATQSKPPSELSQFDIIAEERSDDENTKLTILLNDIGEFQQYRNEGYQIDLHATPTDEDDELGLFRGDDETQASKYSTLNGHSCFRSVEGIYETIHDLASSSNGIAQIIKIGESYLKSKTHNWGYDLLVLKLTSPNNNSQNPPKSRFFAVFGLHAREVAPPEVGLQFAELLIQNYNEDADITQILDHTELHLLLVANPDSRHVVETRPKLTPVRRKNMNFEHGTCSPGMAGIDLNRNFPYRFGFREGVSDDPCSQTYGGPHATSEPEIEAIVRYVTSLFPSEQQRPPPPNKASIAEMQSSPQEQESPFSKNTTGLFLDLHSFGEKIIIPYTYQNTPSPNQAQLTRLAQKFQSLNQYTISAPGPQFWYAASGSALDWAYGQLGCAAYAVEMGTAFFPSCQDFRNRIVPNMIPMLLYGAKVAKAPYWIPMGVDVLEMTLSSVEIGRGESLGITVMVGDRDRNERKNDGSRQPIRSVCVFVDEHPYDEHEPKGRLMEPFDEAFDSRMETAVLSISVLELDVGRHMLHVQGVDGDGVEGPVSSMFFDVVEEEEKLPLGT